MLGTLVFQKVWGLISLFWCWNEEEVLIQRSQGEQCWGKQNWASLFPPATLRSRMEEGEVSDAGASGYDSGYCIKVDGWAGRVGGGWRIEICGSLKSPGRETGRDIPEGIAAHHRPTRVDRFARWSWRESEGPWLHHILSESLGQAAGASRAHKTPLSLSIVLPKSPPFKSL